MRDLLRKHLQGIKEIHKLQRQLKTQRIQNVYYSEKITEFMKNPIRYLSTKAGLSQSDLLLLDRNTLLQQNPHNGAVIRASLHANLRTIFQIWVFFSLLLSSRGEILAPCNKNLFLCSNKNTGFPFPTCALRLKKDIFIFLYFEPSLPVPIVGRRPQQQKLRPDMVAFEAYCKSAETNVFKRFSMARRPLLLVECKESENWHKTTKIIRNPRSTVGEKIKVTHLEMTKLYMELYKPKVMFIVSLVKTPERIVKELAEHNMRTLNNVGFDQDRLVYVVRAMEDFLFT